MNQLAPDLFSGRRYNDLVQLGRSKLPRLAPAWTDHNVHDPGITLMELLAWVAEAQIYSLSRSRRDERTAYAALMGILPNGARPARGLIWPDHNDTNAPSITVGQSFVIEPDGGVHAINSNTPTYRAAMRIHWIPARIRTLVTRLADGTSVDHKGPNQRGGPAFRPFGDLVRRNDVLRMDLEATGQWPLFPRGPLDDARLLIGVRTDEPAAASPAGGSLLEVVLTAGAQRIALPIVEDTTAGFLRTGTLALDLTGLELDVAALTLEFRAPHGLDMPPRIVRIEPNVLPITQDLRVAREVHVAEGMPDYGFDLDSPGLEFEPGSDPVTVEVADDGALTSWTKCKRLSDFGRIDCVYELDPIAARITFGNGINGRMPPAGAKIYVSYVVCEGKGGNMARNRKWVVPGVAGAFGVNPDAVAGGEDPSSWLEQRREGRENLTQAHALISKADIEDAARALPLLKVARTWMEPAQPGDRVTGTTRLIAMQARDGADDPSLVPETPRWLAAIRRVLAPRMALGVRLSVSGPAYVGFTLRANIEAKGRRDPAKVKETVLAELRRRLTLVSNEPGAPERPFGLSVTRRDITSWIHALEDVSRVASLQIVLADGTVTDEVAVPRHGLPRIDLSNSAIDLTRPAGGTR
jgi:predicted phage baseplate assembly protein